MYVSTAVTQLTKYYEVYNKFELWSSYKGRMVNALAPVGEEGRDKLR